MTTTFANKCGILAELWLNYRDDQDWSDFVEYNDIGLPLAYAFIENLVTLSSQAEALVNETFDLLIAGVGLEEDTGFEDLSSILEKLEN